MKRRGQWRWVAIALVTLTLATVSAGAGQRPSDDGFAVYEDWTTSDHIRGDRWRGVSNPAQDTEKEQRGHHAHLRIRREGATGGVLVISYPARPMPG